MRGTNNSMIAFVRRLNILFVPIEWQLRVDSSRLAVLPFRTRRTFSSLEVANLFDQETRGARKWKEKINSVISLAKLASIATSITLN